MAKGTGSNVTRKNARQVVAGKTAAANGEGAASNLAGTAEAVALRAYLIYLEEGCPQGRHLEHWLRAEQEIRV
jgi:hypothetical protein